MNQEICAISFIKEKIILSVVVLKDLQRKFFGFSKVSYGKDELGNKINLETKLTWKNYY